MSTAELGLWEGVASVMGLVGTLVYRASLSWAKLSLAATSAWSLLYMLGCMTASYVSLLVLGGGSSGDTAANDTLSSSSLAITVLVITVCLNRIGLWVFDASVSQIMQETVPPHERGVVGATQNRLQAVFFMAIALLGSLLRNPSQFPSLATIGYAAVGLAAFLTVKSMLFQWAGPLRVGMRGHQTLALAYLCKRSTPSWRA